LAACMYLKCTCEFPRALSQSPSGDRFRGGDYRLVCRWATDFSLDKMIAARGQSNEL
jgi:hypothetical protein